jgi:prepilin peptidase CpaA
MQDLVRFGIPLALTLVALVTDLRRREVPDAVPLAIVAWAIVACLMGWISSWWTLAAGLGVGLAASVPFFYFGGLGGGDVKLLAALGAALGAVVLLKVLFWMALAGGVLAIVSAARGRRDFAYVPAIAAGLCVQTLWPSAMDRLFLHSM